MAINLTSKLDYKIIDQKERIKLVNEALEEYGVEIGDYFDNGFNKHPKCGENGGILSHDDKMCKQLDAVANYILFSPGAERIDKKTEYNFYTEREFEEQEKNKVSINVIIDKNNSHKNDYEKTINQETGNEVIDFLKRKGNNFKKEIIQQITKEDLKDPELKPVKEYQEYINSLKITLDDLRLKKKNKRLQYKLVRHMRFCKTDQIHCKDAIKGTIYFKNILPDTTDIDYNQFDFFDKEHVICLLKFEPRKLTTDLGILIYDLNQLLKKIKLSKQDKKILEYWREDDLTQEDIALKLNITQPHVVSTLNKIADRVIKVFELVYEDWYYLNIVKGKYKKCSTCGKIKLANDKYFYKEPNGKDGFKSSCIKCAKQRKIE